MAGASVFVILGLLTSWAFAQFLNNRPFPTYSLEKMPDTDFTCRDKILGGYYADAETQCQMFHVCVKVAGVGVQDFRFLCPNGTAFDQDHQICAEWDDVDCDATTLYYSSDNFDLYRIGSGLESKAVKYGEDEETFALQRAETGDARLNREPQVQRVNQQKEQSYRYNNNNFHSHRPQQQQQQEEQRRRHEQRQEQAQQRQQQNNNEKDIFKGSSSSNFFNNRNNGKEPEDEEYDNGPTNVNQDDDYSQRRKLRKQNRRPVPQQQQQQRQPQEQPQPERENYPQNFNANNQNYEPARTSRPNRPAGFTNNFAGSSYVPTTTQQPTTVPETKPEQYKNFRRVGHRQRVNADNFRQNNDNRPTPNGQTPAFTLSTPAPFRATQQYNTINRQGTTFSSTTTTQAPKETDNYPTTFVQRKTTYQQQKQTDFPSTIAASTFSTQYDVGKTNPADDTAETNPFTYETKKPIITKQTDNYPTTFAPKFQKFNNQKSTQYNQKITESLPTTFAPRTNVGYTQISQQTTQYTKQQSTQFSNQNIQQTTQFKNQQPTYNQQNDNLRATNGQNSTPRTSPYTQYTPTVPKISTYASTTPVSRSNRFDETQYDDGSYSTKYDNYDDRKDDELIKTAHSTNFASSRNEYNKNGKTTSVSTQKPYYESPRPFSVTPKTTEIPKTTVGETKTTVAQKPIENKKVEPTKKTTKEKNVSYDYAYYDTNVGSEPDYDIGTEIDKVVAKKQ